MHIKYKVWLLFVVTMFAWLYLAVTYEKRDCSRELWAYDVSRWVAEQVQPVRFEAGSWVDGLGRVIGSSATEDSDVCVK